MNIAELKAKQAQLLDKIKNKIEDKGNGGYDDSRFWNVTFDKEKGGGAVIRFLPSPDGPTEMPYEKIIKHFFQGPNGKYYTEASLRTLDKKDPVSDLNYRLYNTKIKSDMDQASNQKQKPRYYANILVVNDPAVPENNGKVFLYEYGPAVQNLIEEKMFPNEVTDPDAESINPFNVFEAPNLLLKLVPQQLGKNIVPNYNKSHFDYKLSELDNIEETINAGYSLAEFKDPTKFKSFKELSMKLVEVLGETTGTGHDTVIDYDLIKSSGSDIESDVVETVSKEPTVTAKATKAAKTPAAEASSSDDDELEKLRKMMEA